MTSSARAATYAARGTDPIQEEIDRTTWLDFACIMLFLVGFLNAINGIASSTGSLAARSSIRAKRSLRSSSAITRIESASGVLASLRSTRPAVSQTSTSRGNAVCV